MPGVGLTPLIQEEYETKLEALQELVSGRATRRSRTPDAAGSTSLPITRGVIEALRDEPDQGLLARATSRVRGRVVVRAGEGIAAPADPADRQEGNPWRPTSWRSRP